MNPLHEGTRVPVPGMTGVQGVVIAIADGVPGFPVYRLNYLTNDGEHATALCGHTDIMQASGAPIPKASPKLPSAIAKRLRSRKKR